MHPEVVFHVCVRHTNLHLLHDQSKCFCLPRASAAARREHVVQRAENNRNTTPAPTCGITYMPLFRALLPVVGQHVLRGVLMPESGSICVYRLCDLARASCIAAAGGLLAVRIMASGETQPRLTPKVFVGAKLHRV